MSRSASCTAARCWRRGGWRAGRQLQGATARVARGSTGAALLVEGISDARKVAASAEQTCVLRAGGRVACSEPRSLAIPPHDVKSPAALELAVAGDDGCVRTARGQVHCWWRDRPPARVRGVSGAVELGLNGNGGCVRRRDGTVWCWGSWRLSRDWQPREGVRLAVKDAVQLAVGLEHACVRLRGGDVRCWSPHSRPYQPHGLRGAIEVLFARGVPCIRRRAGVPLCQRHEPNEDEVPPAPQPEPLLQDFG